MDIEDICLEDGFYLHQHKQTAYWDSSIARWWTE